MAAGDHGPALKRENREVVEHLARGGALDDDMMDALLAVNDADPALAKWYIATVGNHIDPFFNHGYTLPVPLAREAFDRLCLLGLHRLGTESGLVPAALDAEAVKNFVELTGRGLSPERTVGLYHAHRYLSRTPAPLGEIVVARIEARPGKPQALTIEDWMAVRHKAEREYMDGFPAEGPLSLSWFAALRESDGLLDAARHVAGTPRALLNAPSAAMHLSMS